ncbi:glycosyltransferase family 2 protein [Fulvivirga sedimenti]|uniref:Glycosyltransferase family 2 protein n=1 Tax=Fulvivirga sedimenti TaxID=2879465 RepID=A0A9X1HRX8_9BACT|nr:glycosyltransferase family 2 protein [Fulvivirga sedimenti]MCA6075284.1 glycosyltransferase family 2 protein [Fulvivirga sedimenti]MCA6076461.1 glycosyltransferase family 2 protein [Fulvivirga sedimenti]MCA6077589.1 glycosyltransferase family 2 protein [Fulvivirga sedimenti]
MELAPLKISVVTTMLNERENVPYLVESIDNALKGFNYEVIFVDDGSNDGTVEELRRHLDDPHHIVVLNRNYGQTPAMAAGIEQASGEFIVTMDADLQNDPADIPLMLDKLIREDLDLIVGNRKNRKDGFILRKLPSKIANYVIRNISGVHVHDYGCTLKVFRRETAKNLQLYGEMHRFIPILASFDGARISEMNVKHHARKFGKSKYGIGRTMRVLSDLILLLFFQKYLKRPIHLFGPAGLISIGLGSVIYFYLLILKILGQDIWGRPILILGAIFLIGGIQLLTFGIITELIMRTYYESQHKATYKIRRIISKPIKIESKVKIHN